VTGVVLAGGASRRFGSDKAVAEVDGVPMARRVAECLARAGLSPVVAARRERHVLGLETWIEPDGPVHPAWGIACALVRAGGEGVFVAPCDVPDLSVDVVRTLIDARAVAAECPLVGWWPSRASSSLLRGAHEGVAMRTLAEAFCARRAVGPITNCNRPS
jgi:molybdopterin-guanine dinucleotide biosynthesis protein A